jgi:hypothetical protein
MHTSFSESVVSKEAIPFISFADDLFPHEERTSAAIKQKL